MHNIQTITANDSEMEVFFFLPDGPGPHPGPIRASSWLSIFPSGTRALKMMSLP